MTELWKHVAKIVLCNFSRSCNIEVKRNQTTIKSPQVAKHFFNCQSSSDAYKDAYKDAYSCSTQQSQNAVQSKLASYLCCTCQDTDRHQVTNPKKTKMRNPTTNQQQLKKSINAYCAARFLNSSVLTEDQDTTFSKNYLEIFFQVLKNSNWGSLHSKTVTLCRRSDADKK